MTNNNQNSADDDEFIPFDVADYIDIERAGHTPTDKLLKQVEQAISV